jgi:integrase/recombinase XerD
MSDNLSSPYPQAWGVPERDNLSTQGTLEDNYKFFLIYCKVEGFTPKTLSNYQGVLPPLLNFLQKERITRAADITTQHIYAYLLTFKDRVGAYTYHDYFKVIKRFLNWLVEQEIIKENPAAKIKTPRIPRAIITPFTEDDIRKLLLVGDHSITVLLAYHLMAFLKSNVISNAF